MRFDVFGFMLVKLSSIFALKVPSSLLDMPLFAGSPVVRFVPMTPSCPSPPFQESQMVSFAKGFAGVFAAVVLRPPPDDRGELPDQVRWGLGLVPLYYLLDPFLMTVHGLFARSDDGFEADLNPMFPPGFPAVSFPRWKLADFKTQKGETDLSFVTVQGGRDPGLTWLEFQSHVR
jgi:hypothetical protein